MYLPGLDKEPLEFRRQLPLALVGGLCAILAYLWILITGLYEFSFASLPLIIVAGLATVLTLLDVRVGLGLLIFSIGVSPEFSLWGVQNLRMEDFLFPVLLLAWLFRAATANERFAPTNLKLPMLLTVVLSLFSSLQNSIYSQLDLVACFFRLAKSIEYFLIFAMALNVVRRREDFVVFAYLMPLVASLVGIYGIFQSFHSGERVTGPLGETSNILGGYYVFHICLALGLISSGAKHRLVLFACTVLMVIPLLYTMSRTSYVALLVGLLAMFVTRRHAWTAAVLLGSGMAICASAGLSDRFSTILGVLHGDSPNSLVMRMRGWKTFLDYLPSTPIVGQGIGNLTLGAFDNEYIRQVFELGLLGLGFFLWMFERILMTAFRLARWSRDPVTAGFALGCFGATVALLVHSLAATTFSTIRTSEPFFFALGLLYAAGLESEGREPVEEEDLPSELPLAQASRGLLVFPGEPAV